MEVSEGQSAGFQLAMTRFARDCTTRRSCPWAGSAANVLRGINTILAKVDRRPLPTESGRDLVQAEALGALFYAMYSPTLWPSLRQALAQARIGDGYGLQSIADYAVERTGPNTYATNMASAFPAIACWDSPAAPGIAGLRAAASGLVRGCAGARHGQGDVVGQCALFAVVRPLRPGACPGEHDDDGAHPRDRHDLRPGDSVRVGQGAEPAAAHVDAADLPGRRPHRLRRQLALHRRCRERVRAHRDAAAGRARSAAEARQSREPDESWALAGVSGCASCP